LPNVESWPAGRMQTAPAVPIHGQYLRNGVELMAVYFAAPSAMAGIVCLIGPPQSGYAEVADDLKCQSLAVDPTGRSGLHYSGRGPGSARAKLVTQGNEALRAMLRRTLAYMQLASGAGTVGMLPGAPTTATQLHVLRAATRTCGISLSVVELKARDLELTGRAYSCRSCRNCGQVRDADQMDRSGSSGACADCGERDMRWPARELSRFLEELHRYRQRTMGMRTAATNLGLAWTTVDSGSDREVRSSAVRDAIVRLVAGAGTAAEVGYRPVLSSVSDRSAPVTAAAGPRSSAPASTSPAGTARWAMWPPPGPSKVISQPRGGP
jgi:hypothetical protein